MNFLQSLTCAVIDNNIFRAQELLKRGANVDKPYYDASATPLFHAVSSGYTNMARILLEHGANPHHTIDVCGMTPFLLSVNRGYMKCFELLLKHLRHFDDQDSMGQQALHISLVYGHKAMFKALLDAGVNFNAKTNCGESAISYAVRFKDVEAVRLLCERGAEVNCRQPEGCTALHNAVFPGVGRHGCRGDRSQLKITSLHRAMVVDLLAHGANVNQYSDYNFTPLDMALLWCKVNECSCDEFILDMLLLFGAKYPKLYDQKEETDYQLPLVLASFARYFAKRQAIGLDIDAKDAAFIEPRKMHEFKERCDEEIFRIKLVRFGHGLSLYEFLRSDKPQLINYARNLTLEKVHYIENISYKFPIYKSFLKFNFVIVKKYELHYKAADCLLKISDYVLPTLVIDKILSYTSSLDKKRLLKAMM